MQLYRCNPKGSGGGDYSASYTSALNGVIQYGSCADRFRGNLSDVADGRAFTFYIGNNVNTCYEMFADANFNRPVVIPNSVTNCSAMFYRSQFTGIPCYNCDLTIPESVMDVSRMFQQMQTASIDQFARNVYFKGTTYRNLNIYHMLDRAFWVTNGMKRINLFFNSALNNIFNQSLHVMGIPYDTQWGDYWSPVTNGFAAKQSNVYCYYNYSG